MAAVSRRGAQSDGGNRVSKKSGLRIMNTLYRKVGEKEGIWGPNDSGGDKKKKAQGGECLE